MGQLSPKLRSVAAGRGPGVGFWCPGCDEMHVITTGPNGWSYDDNAAAPTFSPSIMVTGVQRLTEDEYTQVMAGGRVEKRPLVCHSFVTGGRIQFLGDCTHSLAGQTVDLPDLPAPEQAT